MKLLLSLHPIIQLAAILLAYYTGYLGVQRMRSLHFGQPVTFQRQRHIIIGAISLLTLLGGFFGGLVIASIFLEKHEGMRLHETVAFILVPLLLIGIATGYYLYRHPKQQKVLPAIHGVNNLIILLLALLQIYSGWHVYQDRVLGG